MKKLAVILLVLTSIVLISIAWLQFSATDKQTKALYFSKKSATVTIKAGAFKKLKIKSGDAKMFISKNNFNKEIFFLIDMSLPSNQNRFFIYDLMKDTISSSGLVTHGRCNQRWLEGRKYSNTEGSGCTSLGKYKIGNFYIGRFGLAFKLYGLEATNNNAFERFVVLHSHECVPETEVSDAICQSDGCPTVSPNFLRQLEPMIKNSEKPVLLWIFN